MRRVRRVFTLSRSTCLLRPSSICYKSWKTSMQDARCRRALARPPPCALESWPRLVGRLELHCDVQLARWLLTLHRRRAPFALPNCEELPTLSRAQKRPVVYRPLRSFQTNAHLRTASLRTALRWRSPLWRRTKSWATVRKRRMFPAAPMAPGVAFTHALVIILHAPCVPKSRSICSRARSAPEAHVGSAQTLSSPPHRYQRPIVAA